MGSEPSTQTTGPGSITVGDFTIQSGQASEEQLKEQFAEEIEKDTKEAASKLGKKGAEAKKAKAEESGEEKPGEEKPTGEEGEKASQEGSETAPKRSEDGEESKAEEDEEKAAEGKDKRKGNPKHDPRARVQQATRQAAEARRERDEALAAVNELRERLDRLERGEKPAAKPEPGEERQAGNGKPDAKDFDDYESYLDARDEWNLARWTQQANEEAQRRNQMSEQDRALNHAVERFRDSVGQDISGWSDEVLQLKTEFQLGENETPTGENWLANELVFNPENAPALGLYLSEHPDEFQAIASLSTPRDVSRAVAKLEARLEAATTGTSPEREERSKAAPPVSPVKGAPYVSDGDPGPKPGESFDAWFKRTKPGKPKF